MSFQRMLMMAAREPQPYLPHPEAVVALYVPRWQTEHGNTLTDWSGNGRDMLLLNTTFSDVSLILESNARGYTNNFADYGTNLTILADRDVSARTSGRGLMLSTQGGAIRLTIEERTTAGYIVRNLGVNNNINLEVDGWIHYRRSDYCGQTLTAGSGTTQGCRISFSGTSGVPTWQRCRALVMWSIPLTDEEIEMAKLFLSTASLEDYMMSRL